MNLTEEETGLPLAGEPRGPWPTKCPPLQGNDSVFDMIDIDKDIV